MAYPISSSARSRSPLEAPLNSQSGSLLELYNQYFEIIPAESPEQVMDCFRLRYQVYCIENPFEDPEQNPHGVETDQFDSAAMHSLLRHRRTGEMVGTVRLILPRKEALGMGLPIRDVCQHELVSRDNSSLPWASTTEISRFAVSKTMRRRAGDGSVIGKFETSDNDPRRRIPDASLGLMQAVVAMASRAGMTHICAVMEPTLLRMLRRLGMVIPLVGPEVNYHGRRQPCYGHLDSGLARVWVRRPDIWELLTSNGEIWPLNMEVAAKIQATEISRPASFS